MSLHATPGHPTPALHMSLLQNEKKKFNVNLERNTGFRCICKFILM